MHRVAWIDNDLNFLIAEEFDLEVLGIHTLAFDSPSAALDWFENNPDDAAALKAVVVDAMLPRNSDERFFTGTDIPVGVVFCDLLKKLELWPKIKNRVVLYTRLPNGARLQDVQLKAKEMDIRLYRKSMTSRIALELFKDNLFKEDIVKR